MILRVGTLGNVSISVLHSRNTLEFIYFFKEYFITNPSIFYIIIHLESVYFDRNQRPKKKIVQEGKACREGNFPFALRCCRMRVSR